MSGKHTLLEAAANAWIEMGCETELLATANATLGMIREIRALEAERDALRKDAERYRFIRPASFVRQLNVVDSDLTPLNDSELDAAIDAAIAAKEPKEPEHAHDWRFSLQDHVYKCDCGATRGDFPFGPATFKD